MTCLHPSEDEILSTTARHPSDLASTIEDVRVARSNVGIIRTVYAQNKGLLIIALSELLFSFMFTAIKLMTVGGTPVPTFEVCH
jgi:hypothetical protein